MSVQPMGAELGPPACLPANWKTVRLGDVCKIQGGFAFKSADYVKEGVPLVRISNLVNARVSFDSDTVYLSEAKLSLHREFILEKGDTLIAMSGATTGKMATFDLDTPALLNQRVGRFRILSEDSCTPRFISLLVTQITKKVLKEAYGAAQPNISPTQIEQFEIPLPPLDEQLRIVAEIEKQFTRLDSGVAALRRVHANLKRYRAAVLKAACEGQLVPTEAELHQSAGEAQKEFESGEELLKRILDERRQRWTGRGKYTEPTQPDCTSLPPLPAGWVWASIEQLSNVVRGASPRPAGDPKYFGGIIPWITVGPLTADKSPYLHFVRDTLNEAGREHSRYVEPHALLFTNSGATLGVPKITLIGGCINDGVAALLDLEYPLKLYLLYFLHTQTGTLRGVNQGAAQPNLNTTIIKAIKVPLPPLAEQTRIVAEVERRLSVVEELDSMVAANVQRATRLRQSILQKAFSGELL